MYQSNSIPILLTTHGSALTTTKKDDGLALDATKKVTMKNIEYEFKKEKLST